MPLSSSAGIFSAFSEGIIPLLLGGTGKKLSEDQPEYFHGVYSGMQVSSLQSLIAFMASNIANLEYDKAFYKFIIRSYSTLQTTKDLSKDETQHYLRIIANANKQLIRLRKIQTELKRQRAGKV